MTDDDDDDDEGGAVYGIRIGRGQALGENPA
jgi:hypothetical protein